MPLGCIDPRPLVASCNVLCSETLNENARLAEAHEAKERRKAPAECDLVYCAVHERDVTALAFEGLRARLSCEVALGAEWYTKTDKAKCIVGILRHRTTGSLMHAIAAEFVCNVRVCQSIACPPGTGCVVLDAAHKGILFACRGTEIVTQVVIKAYLSGQRDFHAAQNDNKCTQVFFVLYRNSEGSVTHATTSASGGASVRLPDGIVCSVVVHLLPSPAGRVVDWKVHCVDEHGSELAVYRAPRRLLSDLRSNLSHLLRVPGGQLELMLPEGRRTSANDEQTCLADLFDLAEKQL